jgi:hypothetical protein
MDIINIIWVMGNLGGIVLFFLMLCKLIDENIIPDIKRWKNEKNNR